MPKRFALLCILPILLGTSLRAQSQTASPEPTIWDHNGSVMYLVATGSSLEFYYQKPRPGMLEAGALPGTLLFRGQINNGQFSGTAYIFNARCGQIPFQVKGPILDNNERVLLTGQAPRVGRGCRTYGYYTSNLEFKLLKSSEVAQSQQSLATEQTPIIAAPKPQVLARDAGEPKPPSSPTAQPSVTNETPLAAKDLENQIWAAVLILMTVSLFGFSIWILIKNVLGERMR
jgi:hypothetical protein